MNSLGPAQHDCLSHQKSPSELQPGQFRVTVKVSYNGCCLKSQGKDAMPEDKVGLLRWHTALSALLLVADTLELVNCVECPGQVSDKPIHCSLY